jgi:hypothetical protein
VLLRPPEEQCCFGVASASELKKNICVAHVFNLSVLLRPPFCWCCFGLQIRVWDFRMCVVLRMCLICWCCFGLQFVGVSSASKFPLWIFVCWCCFGVASASELKKNICVAHVFNLSVLLRPPFCLCCFGLQIRVWDFRMCVVLRMCLICLCCFGLQFVGVAHDYSKTRGATV